MIDELCDKYPSVAIILCITLAMLTSIVCGLYLRWCI